MRRRGGVGGLIGLLLVVLPLAIAAPTAYTQSACQTGVVSWTTTTTTTPPSGSGAAPIAGASYSGVAADGANVAFTVSPDGTRLDSYSIGNSHGDTCSFYAGGAKGVWEGTPINGGAFEYRLYTDSLVFSGSFSGQSATGTFQFHNAAAGGGSQNGGGGTSQNGGGGNVQGNGVGLAKRTNFATRVTLRKLSAKRLGGRVISSSQACRAGRTMILWRGSRRIASTRAQASGRYSFPRTARLRGQRVRVTAVARSVAAGTCVAGSSALIRA